MKENLMKIGFMVLAVVIALIVYNKFVAGIVGSFESSNYEVDDNGNVMKVAA